MKTLLVVISIVWAAAWLGCASPGNSFPVGSLCSESGGQIRRAIHHSGKLYILTTGIKENHHELWLIEANKPARTLRSNVIDIATNGSGTLFALIDQANAVQLIDLESTQHIAELAQSKNSRWVGLAANGSSWIALRDDAVFVVQRGGPVRSQHLSEKLVQDAEHPLIESLPGSNDVLIGSDHGEFGGGLVRLDVSTGEVRAVEHCLAGAVPCSSADVFSRRNTRILAMIVDEEDPDCVIVAARMPTATSVVQVCGARVIRLARRDDKSAVGISGLRFSSSGLHAFDVEREYVISNGALLPTKAIRWQHCGSLRAADKLPFVNQAWGGTTAPSVGNIHDRLVPVIL